MWLNSHQEGFKPVRLYADTMNTRAWPGGMGFAKAGGNYAPTIQPAVRAQEEHGCAQARQNLIGVVCASARLSPSLCLTFSCFRLCIRPANQFTIHNLEQQSVWTAEAFVTPVHGCLWRDDVSTAYECMGSKRLSLCV